MSRKKSNSPFRHVGGEVPAQLLDDLDKVAESLGLIKKRLLAAAVAAFIRANSEDQLRLYQEVYSLYYTPQATGADGLAKDAAAALGAARRAKAAKVQEKTA